MELHLLSGRGPLVGLVSLVYAHNGPLYIDFSTKDLPRLSVIREYPAHFVIFISMLRARFLKAVSNMPRYKNNDRTYITNPITYFAFIRMFLFNAVFFSSFSE